MLRSLRIGIKFCGNCNPHISGKDLIKNLEVEAKNAGVNLVFCSWDQNDLDYLFIISGCPIDCATRPNQIIAALIVAGETLDGQRCSQPSIARETIKKLQMECRLNQIRR